MIKTNHQSSKELMSQVNQIPKQQYYVTKLLGYDFDIEYRFGKSLARLLVEYFQTYSTLGSAIIFELSNASVTDVEL